MEYKLLWQNSTLVNQNIKNYKYSMFHQFHFLLYPQKIEIRTFSRYLYTHAHESSFNNTQNIEVIQMSKNRGMNLQLKVFDVIGFLNSDWHLLCSCYTTWAMFPASGSGSGLFFFLVLSLEPSAVAMLGKHSTPELHPQPTTDEWIN
jgi:hypothetical protein